MHGGIGVGTLETLFWVYPLLLLLNGFVAVALWAINRKSIFGLLVGFWCSSLVNFAAQGALLNSSIGTILAFSTYIVAAWFLCRIIAWLAHQSFSFYRYWLIYSLALLASLVIHAVGFGFTAVAFPVAVALALPQISFAIKTLRDQQLHTLVRIFAIVLLVNGLHFIDYPFLRPIPEAAVFGYSLVIATSMLFGVLLPCVINNSLAEELTQQLRDEVASHQKTAQELEQALVITEQSSRAKTVFLANVSHHLRTPINGIMGLNDLLLESKLEQHQRDLAQQVRVSSNALLNMVDNVLTISLLESGNVKLYPKAFSIQQLINDVFDHYASCGSLQQRLIIEPEESHQQWIYADELKIRQILFNIIDNAIKHSEASRIALGIWVDANTELLHIQLADDGIGVATERLANLAQPFKQEAQSIHCGMGLGLSLVRELVGLMSGELVLDSQPTQGLRVYCQLPVRLLPGNYVAPSLEAGDGIEAKSQASLVLVVEDNPVNRMVISGMLKKLAVNFCMAEDGAQAMDLYSKHRQQLACILMDVQLPDANGLDLIEKIRCAGDKVPVLVISAFTFGDDEARAIRVGADAYLRKPYHFNEFKHALGNLGVPANFSLN